MDGEVRHLVGLLLGTEDDWPRAFEFLLSGLGPVTDAPGRRHVFSTERLTIDPFSLRAKPRTDLVIDRLGYWYFHPREWLKKIALVDDVYLLNSPFSFQAMEKHAAYCAMIRLGLKIPETVLVPYKNPLDNAKYAYTSQRYNSPFDLDEVAGRLGYPLYMKPFDGGGWLGVSRIRNAEELHRAYNSSGEMLMHLQAAVEGFDVFARALSIGAETMVMRFDPDAPMHSRYRVEHEFLQPAIGAEAIAISRIINAFFRWEFNSCEMLVKGDDVFPIDYANACPDVSITSLHYYFPWAMRALVKWTVFCLATGRRAGTDLHTRAYFDISDRGDLDYQQKLAGYLKLADSYFAVEEYHQFCADQLPDIDQRALEWATGPEFDRLIIDTVTATYPEHEHDRFVAHFRGLTSLWARDEAARLVSSE
ncbi:MAG: hypothetical protein ABSB01_15015 [Streptosporangiaceae bacterium]